MSSSNVDLILPIQLSLGGSLKSHVSSLDTKINKMKKYFFILLMLFSFSLAAQDKIPVTEQDYTNNQVEMADAMRADGKIYVVVAVLVVIFAGITAYAIGIDRKLGRLEKEFSAGKTGTKRPA